MKNYATPFDYNIICQVCRKKIKASVSLKRWDGLIVCKDDYETRHPLDMPAPRQSVERVLPFTYSEPVDTETTIVPHALAGSDPVPGGNFKTNNETI